MPMLSGLCDLRRTGQIAILGAVLAGMTVPRRLVKAGHGLPGDARSRNESRLVTVEKLREDYF